MIAQRYLKGSFWFDFVTWIPFWLYFDNRSYWRVLFSFKVFRINRTIEVTCVSDLMQWIKDKKTEHVKALIEENANVGEDTITDHNHIK